MGPMKSMGSKSIDINITGSSVQIIMCDLAGFHGYHRRYVSSYRSCAQFHLDMQYYSLNCVLKLTPRLKIEDYLYISIQNGTFNTDTGFLIILPHHQFNFQLSLVIFLILL